MGGNLQKLCYIINCEYVIQQYVWGKMSEYLFKNVDSYDTPDDCRKSLMFKLCGKSRWFFYYHNFGVFCRSGRCGQAGKLDADHQISLSNENIRLIESCGGRIHLRGLNNLRNLNMQPVVLAGNHMSLLETAILHAITREYVDFSFIIKRSLLDIPYFRDILHTLDAVPITRNNPREDLKTVLTEGKRVLTGGRSMVVFPQGTRSREFNPEHFSSIALKLAKSSGVPIVPMALKTDFIGQGKWLRDLGPVYPEREVWFEFGQPIEITGNGAAQQQIIVDFIKSRVDKWLELDKK